MILFFAFADMASNVRRILDALCRHPLDFDEVFILIDRDNPPHEAIGGYYRQKPKLVVVNEDGSLCRDTLPDSELARLTREDTIFCTNGGADHFRWALHNLAVALGGHAYRVVPGDAKSNTHVVEMKFE